MTDREMLMLLYGAIKVNTNDDGVIEADLDIGAILKKVEDHLWTVRNENAMSPK
jgi:hypothetical protein